MTSKGRRSITSSLWFTCDDCSCFISHKDLQEHQLNDCNKLKLIKGCERNVGVWKQVYIKNNILYGFMEECKAAENITIVAKDVVLLSQSAMQLCQFIIGDPVIVESILKVGNGPDGDSCLNSHCEVKTVWPTTDGSVTSIFCPKQGLETTWGLTYGPVKIMKLMSTPIPASDIIFQFTKQTDIPEKIDSFINMLRYQTIGKVFHVNSRIGVEFYGKRLKLILLKIDSSKSNACEVSNCNLKDVEDIISNMKTLNTSESDIDTSDVANNSSRDVLYDIQFYQIFENTRWCLKKDEMSNSDRANIVPNALNLKDVGGFNDILKELQCMMVNCLKKPVSDLHFKNIRTVKGVLLHGLHGVGKTHIAHSLANSSGAFVIAVQSGDLFSKFYGEAESRLRSIFEEALVNSPSVMILDDIDTICPKRGSSDQERRVVATLLSLLDSLEGFNVFVLATTSQIHIIDPAIRRPGRLDHEIELPVPSLSDREDILMKMLKGPQLLDDEDLIRKTAAIAHGYVGADLSAVVSQAYTRAAQVNDNVINAEILEWAIGQVKPSAMREVLVRVPDVKWSDIGGQDRLKLQLRQAVEWPLNHPDAFIRLGITPPRGVLMFGPPGCSKTMIAKALATESKLNFISIKGPELFSKWVGESERAVRAVFKRARSVAPSIVFLDELDAIAGERGGEPGGSGGSASVQERVLAQLLTELDGVEPLRNVIIIAATNRPDRIDKALLRPGRLDRLIYVPLPDLATRHQILKLQFRKTPVSSDTNIDILAGLMDGYSGAEVVAVCHEAALNALEENSSANEVKMSHFTYALNIVIPRTPNSLLELYERYISR